MSARTAVETIQAAIEKLEEFKTESTPSPWTAMEYDDNPGDQGVPIIGGGEAGSMKGHLTAYTMTLGNEEQSVVDADLIVTLHRTIDAQLAILHHALTSVGVLAGWVTVDNNAYRLAAAILGESS